MLVSHQQNGVCRSAYYEGGVFVALLMSGGDEILQNSSRNSESSFRSCVSHCLLSGSHGCYWVRSIAQLNGSFIMMLFIYLSRVCTPSLAGVRFHPLHKQGVGAEGRAATRRDVRKLAASFFSKLLISRCPPNLQQALGDTSNCRRSTHVGKLLQLIPVITLECRKAD